MTPAGIEPATFRFVAQHLNHCATAMKTKLNHYLSSVYFVSQPLHASGIFVAHHQEVYCIYTTIGTCCAVQLTVFWPAGRLQICPKHVEVD